MAHLLVKEDAVGAGDKVIVPIRGFRPNTTVTVSAGVVAKTLQAFPSQYNILGAKIVSLDGKGNGQTSFEIAESHLPRIKRDKVVALVVSGEEIIGTGTKQPRTLKKTFTIR